MFVDSLVFLRVSGWPGSCSPNLGMKLWKNLSGAADQDQALMRHDLVIGPLCDGSEHKGRLYYCSRCGWTVLVSDGKAEVLKEPENSEDRMSRQLGVFDACECPLLEAFASEFPPRSLIPAGWMRKGPQIKNGMATGPI